jgi:hypothetical protein
MEETVKKLTPKQLKAIDMLVHRDDLTQKQITVELGINESTLYRWFYDSSFSKCLEDEQRKYLQAVGVQALKIIKKMANDEDTPANVKYQAAKDLADRSGWKAVDKIENTGTAPTYNFQIVPVGKE